MSGKLPAVLSNPLFVQGEPFQQQAGRQHPAVAPSALDLLGGAGNSQASAETNPLQSEQTAVQEPSGPTAHAGGEVTQQAGFSAAGEIAASQQADAQTSGGSTVQQQATAAASDVAPTQLGAVQGCVSPLRLRWKDRRQKAVSLA